MLMRDAAAADHSAAAAADAAAAEELAERERALADTLDDAADRLAAARSVIELAAIAEFVDGDHHAVTEAHHSRAAATAAADRAADQLRDRVRELKTSERARDRLVKARDHIADRVEQAASDDRASRPRRGSP
jgi:flagellar biosynthesis chaperone FliJ